MALVAPKRSPKPTPNPAPSKLLLAALEYAADGVPVFPLHDVSEGPCSCGKANCSSQAKHPRTPHGFEDASVDPAQINAWWAKWPQANIGLATGHGIAVLDIDGPEGLESLRRLVHDRGYTVNGVEDTPDTYTVRTQSGGAHVYFSIPDGAGITLRSFGSAYPKLDVRGVGGYVVAPPSVGPLGAYVVELAVPVVPWPTELLPPTKSEAGHAAKGPDVEGETTCDRAEHAIERATEYLAKAPPAIQGRGGHTSLLLACAGAFAYGLTSSEVFELIRDVYSPRCVPPFDDASEIWHKVEEARTKSEMARHSVAHVDAVRTALNRAKAPTSAPDEGAEYTLTAEDVDVLDSVEISDDEIWRLALKGDDKNKSVAAKGLKALNSGAAIPFEIMARVAQSFVFRTKGKVSTERALEFFRISIRASTLKDIALDESGAPGAAARGQEEAAQGAIIEQALNKAHEDYARERAEKDATLDAMCEHAVFMSPWDRFVLRLNNKWDLASPLTPNALEYSLKDKNFSLEDIKSALAEKHFKSVNAVACMPGMPDIVQEGEVKKLNTYMEPTIEAEEGFSPAIDKLIAHLTGYDEGGIWWLKNWIAHLIQNPGVIGMTAPVIWSKETGTGKSTLGKIIQTMVGAENCAEIGQRELSRTFNHTYATALFVCANEIFTTDKQEDQKNVLKALISDGTITVNMKGVKEYSVKNRTSWLITSNNRTPVRLEGEDERRYTIFEADAPTPEYVAAVFDVLFDARRDFSDEGMREVRAFLHEMKNWQVDVKAAAKPYKNTARAALAEASASIEKQFMDECLDVGPAAVVDQYPPDDWRGGAKPQSATWNFGEQGISQKILGETFRAYCKVHGGGYMPALRSFTAVARGHGVVVRQITYGSRCKAYLKWPEPKTKDVSPMIPGRLLPLRVNKVETAKEAPFGEQVEHIPTPIDFSKPGGIFGGSS